MNRSRIKWVNDNEGYIELHEDDDQCEMLGSSKCTKFKVVRFDLGVLVTKVENDDSGSE